MVFKPGVLVADAPRHFLWRGSFLGARRCSLGTGVACALVTQARLTPWRGARQAWSPETTSSSSNRRATGAGAARPRSLRATCETRSPDACQAGALGGVQRLPGRRVCRHVREELHQGLHAHERGAQGARRRHQRQVTAVAAHQSQRAGRWVRRRRYSQDLTRPVVHLRIIYKARQAVRAHCTQRIGPHQAQGAATRDARGVGPRWCVTRAATPAARQMPSHTLPSQSEGGAPRSATDFTALPARCRGRGCPPHGRR